MAAPAGAEPVGDAGAGVLLVDDDRHAPAPRGEVGGRADVATEADDDLGRGLVDGGAGGGDRGPEVAGQAQQVTARPPRQRDLGHEAQVDAAGRHEPGLETLPGAERGDAHVGVAAPQGVGEGEQRRHVAGAAPSREQDGGGGGQRDHRLLRRDAIDRGRDGSTASDRRSMLGRASSRALQPGSLRAKESRMPRASRVVTSEDPPAETSGSGTPMTGKSPMTAPMLMMACPMQPRHDAGARDAHEAVLGAADEAEAGPGQHGEEREDHQRARQAELLADDGEDEVVVGLGEPLPLLLGGAEPDAPPAAVGEGVHAVHRLAAHAVGVGLAGRVEEVGDAAHAVAAACRP